MPEVWILNTISVQTSNHAVWLCVCVLSLKGRWDFFPTGHQIKTSYFSCSLFTAFFISLLTIFYIFLHLFVLLVSSLLLSLSLSHLCYLWLCFAVPSLLMCLFLQLFTYSFSTVCISGIHFYYMFIYLFACLEVLENNGKMHPNVQIFIHFSA